MTASLDPAIESRDDRCIDRSRDQVTKSYRALSTGSLIKSLLLHFIFTKIIKKTDLTICSLVLNQNQTQTLLSQIV